MNEGEERAVIRKYDLLESKESIVEVFRHFNIIKRETGLSMIRSIISDIDKAYNPLLALPPEMLSHLFLYLEIEEIVVKRTPFLIHPYFTRRLMDYFPLWLDLYERCTKESVKRNPDLQLSNVRFFVKNFFCAPKTFRLRRSRDDTATLNMYQNYNSFPKNLILITSDVRENEYHTQEGYKKKKKDNAYPKTCDIFRDLEYLLWNPKEATFTSIGLVTQASFTQRGPNKYTKGSESIRAAINDVQLFELFLWQSESPNKLTCHFKGFQELEKVLELFKKTVVYKGSFNALGLGDIKHPTLRKIVYCICVLFQVLVAKNEERVDHFVDLGEERSTILPENVSVKTGRARQTKQRLDEFLKTENFFEDNNF